MNYDELKKCIIKDNLSMEDELEISTCEGCDSDCCKNRDDIIMNPYDLYKLAKYLKTTTLDIVKKYCDTIIGCYSGIPLVILKQKRIFNYIDYEDYNVCTFLKKKDGKYKCSIHDVKPAICGMFPVGRRTSFTEDMKLTKIIYMLTNTNLCSKEKKKIKLKDWLKNHNIDDSEEAFMLYMQSAVRFNNIINIEKLNTNITSDTLNTFYDSIINIFYNVDLDKPMLEAIKESSDKFVKFVEKFAYAFKDFPQQIHNDNFVFKDEYENENYGDISNIPIEAKKIFDELNDEVIKYLTDENEMSVDNYKKEMAKRMKEFVEKAKKERS